MQATKKIAIAATLFTGMTMGVANANNAHNHNGYNGHGHNGHNQNNHGPRRIVQQRGIQGVWKKRHYDNGPINKVVVKKVRDRRFGNQFRVTVFGDCGPRAPRQACVHTERVAKQPNGKLKMRYPKGNRMIVLKISKEGPGLRVVRKVKRHGNLLRRTEQFMKRKRNGQGWNQYNRRADLAVTYATGRWNRRLQCYEVTANVRNVGNKMAKATVIRATNNGRRGNKVTQKIRALAPGESKQVKLIFNHRVPRGVQVEVNPGRRTVERNYNNNVRNVN